MNPPALLAALLAGACALSTHAADAVLTKAQAGKVEVSKCYLQCFSDVAAQDRGPVLREEEGNYRTEHSSWNGVKRCMAAVHSQFVMEQCSTGCEDVRSVYGNITSAARTRYLAAQRSRRAFLRGRGLLPAPAAYATFDQTCSENAWDGLLFYGLRWRAWSSDPDFGASSDDSAAYPVAAAPRTGLTARFMRQTWGDSVAHLSDHELEEVSWQRYGKDSSSGRSREQFRERFLSER